MSLTILPPEMLEPQDKIQTIEKDPYWRPSFLKDGESEEFRLLGCYGTGHAIRGWEYPSEIQDPKNGELRFNGYVVTRSHPGSPPDISRETDWSKAERPKIDGVFAKPRSLLAWVATSAERNRLEILMLTQSIIDEQLTEILQEVEDYTWTEEGLANFSIKFSRKGSGRDTRYTLMPKVRPVPEKIKNQWATEQNSIWLPNFFEGKNPFDGKQVEDKGLPAGGRDKRGAHVEPAKAKTNPVETNEEF